MKIPNVLIVDDEAGWRSLYRFELEGDYYITEAGDGHEAMAAIQRGLPDLIILDLMMPGMNGFTLLQELEQRGANVPVILSTAVPLGEDPCYLLGHQVVAKSTNLKSLRRAIERVLERSVESRPARGSTKKKKKEEILMGLLWCAMVLAWAAIVGIPLSAGASDVNVSGGVSIQFGNPPPPPPPVIVQTPPSFVVIPGSVVSYAPSLHMDLFLFQGKYFYFHNGAWFTAKAHKGPWIYVASPPPAIVQIPVVFYKVPPGHLKKDHERGGKGRKGKDRD